MQYVYEMQMQMLSILNAEILSQIRIWSYFENQLLYYVSALDIPKLNSFDLKVSNYQIGPQNMWNTNINHPCK